MKKIIIFVCTLIIVLIAYNFFSKVANTDYAISIGGKRLIVSDEKWSFIPSEESLYSKNYGSVTKNEGDKFEQVITVFLQKMTEDRKIGEKLSDNEYIEAFIVNPNSVTVQIRIDKGDYWVMSRETFESKNSYPMQTNISYSDLIKNFEGIHNKIDNTKYILNNDF